MPIDSVSSACPARRLSHRAASAQRLALPAGSLVGSGIAIRPRSRRRGSCATRARQRRQFSRRDAALAGFAADVDLHADVERRQAGGRCSDRRCAIFRRSTAVHPVEVLRDRAGLVALDRADEMPFERRRSLGSARDLFHALPARSFRRRRAGRSASGREHRLGRKGLADREQCHVALQAPARLRAAGNALVTRSNGLQGSRDCGHNRLTARTFSAIAIHGVGDLR